MRQKNRLKHLGIFWGMSPMNLFLQEEKYLNPPIKAHTRKHQQKSRKTFYLKKTTICI